ncbi:MAG: PepSY-like domain-containing protein [Ferruginibacter sp.]
MKTPLLFAIAIVLMTVAAHAQKIGASKVPVAVRSAFGKQYPKVKPAWEKENGEYEAEFKQNGVAMSASFDPNGTMKESETGIKITDLPAAVLSYVKMHYKGKTIGEASKITKADGAVNYEAEVSGKDVIFDAAGKFIKEAKD